MESKRFLNEHETAALLGLSVLTLRDRRYRGKPPVYAKFGRIVRYEISDLEDFISASKIHPKKRETMGH